MQRVGLKLAARPKVLTLSFNAGSLPGIRKCLSERAFSRWIRDSALSWELDGHIRLLNVLDGDWAQGLAASILNHAV